MNVWEYLEKNTPNPLEWMNYLDQVFPEIDWHDPVTETMFRQEEYLCHSSEAKYGISIQKKTARIEAYTDNKTALFLAYAPEIKTLYAMGNGQRIGIKLVEEVHEFTVDPNDIPDHYAIGDDGEIVPLGDAAS